VCSRPFVLSEEDEIILKQLELGALLESTLSRFCLVVYLGKFLPSSKLNKNKQTKAGVAIVLTTTRDFFTPLTTSLERYGSPSGYNAVMSLW
jgi:hypothetical protein